MPTDIVVVRLPTASNPPALGTPVRVELRDTSLADASSVVLAVADDVVTGSGAVVAIAHLTLDDIARALPAADLTLWAHVGFRPVVASGDLLTMVSVPLHEPDVARGFVVVPVAMVG